MKTRPVSVLSRLLLALLVCGSALTARAQDPMTDPAPYPNAPPPMQQPAPPAMGTYQTGQDPTMGTGASPGYMQTERRRTWPNRPLLGTSALTFTAGYLPALITTAVNDDDTSKNLYIPIAGPWMEIAREDTSGGNKALLSLSGILQGLGALGLVTSFFVPEERTKTWYLMGNRRFQVAPVASRQHYGLGASGRF